MNFYRISRPILLIVFLSTAINVKAGDLKPANHNAAPEAKALLNLLYNISGKYILTGQHNFPNTKDENSEFASKYIGKTPVIFSSDFGFAKDGDKDSYLARKDIVNEAIKQHQAGHIVALMWHAVPPTADEPVVFQMSAGKASPDSLASVQGKLLDQQYEDLLTPGTKIYNHWCAQVDSIAFYLKLLRDAHVPILWRPYHEMNGDWFWWGGRQGKNGTAALYRQLFDRLVNYHKLNNLIWVWSVDRPSKPERDFSYYFPGSNFVDVLSLDVYGRDFNQIYYETLEKLANGKVIALAEVGNPPTSDILKSQPMWAYYITWAGMVRNTFKKQYDEIMNDSRVLCYNDSVYCKILNPYRLICGLPPIYDSLKSKTDFSGNWVFNEEKSILDNMGTGNLPSLLQITQSENILTIQRTIVQEYTEDRITVDHLTLDGKENKSEMFNAPVKNKANWSSKFDTLYVASKATFKFGDRTIEMNNDEKWFLQDQGKILFIVQSSNSARGRRKITMVFDKK
ncbi:MAG: glycosyl hydrolase [Ignavibacteriaceae bacterium]